MIRVHRLNGVEVLINAELIETVQLSGQQTMIRLTTGNSFLVQEAIEDVEKLNNAYRQQVFTERRAS